MRRSRAAASRARWTRSADAPSCSSDLLRHFVVLNPNTSAATTEAMCLIAREAAGDAARFSGMTARNGAAVITDPAALANGAAEIAAMIRSVPPCDGALVGAFGDPGLMAARTALPVPVTGLAEAAIGEATAGGRRFAIVTTTPALDTALRGRVAESGAFDRFTGLHYTRSGPAGMGDADRLHAELLIACRAAIEQGAEAVVIGGGPLAVAARGLRGLIGAALIEPVPAAVRLLLARAEAYGRRQCPTSSSASPSTTTTFPRPSAADR